MKRAFLWAGIWVLLGLLLGCAATTRQRIVQPVTENLAYVETLMVEVAPEAPANFDERLAFGSQLVERLRATQRFFMVVIKSSQHREAADLLVRCEISAIGRVTPGDRAIGGALAGRASLSVTVSLFDPASGARLGRAEITSRSSGGSVFAGTTAQAIELAAQAAAVYVASQFPARVVGVPAQSAAP